MENSDRNTSEPTLQKLGLEDTLLRLQTFKVVSDAICWHRIFGATLIALVILLFLSGAFLALYYSPAPGAAYDSVDFSLYTVPFGAVIKGIHHYGWNLMLIVMGLHMVRAFIVGAYKHPRQLVWLTGVVLVIIVPLFIITGDLLPWDQKGYWSTQVRLSIIATVPLIGDFLVQLLQGGPLTGIVALTRFYVLHILFIPALFLCIVVMHLHLIRYRGLSDPLWSKKSLRSSVRFWPIIINRWLFLFLILTILLGFISWYWPAPLGDPADPTDSTFIPKPEWWVLFLNQLVAIFKGPLTPIGSTIVPAGLVLGLIALPYLDRSKSRHPLQRKTIFAVVFIIIAALVALSAMGYIEHFGSDAVN